MKRQLTKWEKLFANYSSNIEVSKIYEELNSKTTGNNLVKKLTKGLTTHFSKKGNIVD